MVVIKKRNINKQIEDSVIENEVLDNFEDEEISIDTIRRRKEQRSTKRLIIYSLIGGFVISAILVGLFTYLNYTRLAKEPEVLVVEETAPATELKDLSGLSERKKEVEEEEKKIEEDKKREDEAKQQEDAVKKATETITTEYEAKIQKLNDDLSTSKQEKQTLEQENTKLREELSKIAESNKTKVKTENDR